MTLIFKVYPKRGLVLEGTEQQLITLIEQGIIEETEGNTAQFTSPFKLSMSRNNDEALKVFVTEQWQPLFPSEKVQASNIAPYYVSGNTQQCIRYMKEFIKEYKGKYDFDCIFIATAAYLADKSGKSFNGTSKNFNFIRRELENWCDEYLRNPEATFNQAKRYYEYVKRAATRQRAKRVSRAGFGLSAIVGRGDHVPVISSGGGQDEHLRPSTSIKLKPNAIAINRSHKREA